MTSIAVWALLASSGASRWSVNENSTLIWDGKPYLPVGLHIQASSEAIDEAKNAGIQDLLIDLAADSRAWKDPLDRMDQAGMRYLIRITSLMPIAEGIAVEPEGYRVPKIDTARKIEVSIPGATSALCVMALQSDGTVTKSAVVPVIGGKLSYDADPDGGLEHVLLIYPQVRQQAFPDFWEGFDAHRDRLLEGLQANAKRPGLRGLVNPMGRLLSFPSVASRFVPTSEIFRTEFENYLAKRYASVATAVKTWSMGASDIEDFATLSRLVPLWTESRGVHQLWDPKTNKLYPCDPRRSRAWTDLNDSILATARRRYERLAASIRSLADVPVIQEYLGVAGPYDTARPVVNGIGMQLHGATPTEFIDAGATAAGTFFRRNQAGWLLATSVQPYRDAAGQSQFENSLLEASSLGARGWFFEPGHGLDLKKIAGENAARIADPSDAQWKPSVVFYPESLANPVASTRISGGLWWLPCSITGTRIDFSDKYYGFRMADSRGDVTVLWAPTPTQTKLRASDAKLVSIQSADGADLKPKVRRNVIELTLSPVPVIISGIDDSPVPEDSLREITATLQQMLDAASKRRIPVEQEKFALKELAGASERTPGAAYQGMRKLLDAMNMKYGTFLWREGESTRDTTFSEFAPIAGCSGGSALSLRGRIPQPGGSYAKYDVTVRVEGEHEVWIAARLSDEQRTNISVQVGNQPLQVVEGPISRYGLGFGWYRLGSAGLAPGPLSVTVFAPVAEGEELAIDTIVLSPSAFRPNGISIPMADLWRKIAN